jgi:hypothetical protein
MNLRVKTVVNSDNYQLSKKDTAAWEEDTTATEVVIKRNQKECMK